MVAMNMSGRKTAFVSLAIAPALVLAGDPAVLYRVVTTGETAITGITRDLLSWTNSSGDGAFVIEASTGADVPWQPVDAGESGVSRSLLQPASPIPQPAAIVGIATNSQGDVAQEGHLDEQPVIAASGGPFFMDRYEVTAEAFRDHYQWAYELGRLTITSSGVWNAHGDSRRLYALNDKHAVLSFSNGMFRVRDGFEDRPITHVTWFGALAYANFRSERAGLPLCIDMTNWTCVFHLPGYRLPTEAEWERAARGAAVGLRFPWGGEATNLWDDIDTTRANYWASGDAYEDTNNLYLTPAGSFTNGVNPLNLQDLAGNVYEWCWDWYDYGWYSNALAEATNSAGPDTGLARVVRGGAWSDPPDLLRVSSRSSALPHAALPFIGFRCVRTFGVSP